MKKIWVMIGCLAMVGVSAQASIIYNLTSETASGANTVWTYSAVLSADQNIDTTHGFSNFAVIYDFGAASGLGSIVSVAYTGVHAGVTTPTTTLQLTGPTAASQNPPDSGSLINVVTNLSGTFDGAADQVIYNVVITTLGGAGLAPQALLYESGQASKDAPGDPSNFSATGNTARIEGPSAVPEPMTFSLMGLGLLGFGLLKKRLS